MEEHFVWMTTRQIRPGTLTDFERAGGRTRIRRACCVPTRTGQRTSGKSSGSRFGPPRSRAKRGVPPTQKRAGAAMAPYVVAEQEAFYRGRELVVPAR
jgi:hypothetical protein